MKGHVMDVRSDEVRRGQGSYSLAEQQRNEAIQIMEQGGLRSVAGIKEYQNAVALLKEIRKSLGPMDHKLRSPELKPTFGLDRTNYRASGLTVNSFQRAIDKLLIPENGFHSSRS